VARFDALVARANVGAYRGDMQEVVAFMERAYALAMDAGRKDLQTTAAQVLAQTHLVSLELDEAELLLTRALELAGESGSVRARFGATLSYGWFLMIKGELAAAETVFEEVRQTATELGVEPGIAAALSRLGEVAWYRQDYRRAEKLYREALRITSSRGDRGVLPDLLASLAEALALLGKVEEAERLALELEGTSRPDDVHAGVTLAMTWAAVRAAEGRDDEAEGFYRSALDNVTSGYAILELVILERLVRFYRERDREEDASACEARIAELVPAAPRAPSGSPDPLLVGRFEMTVAGRLKPTSASRSGSPVVAFRRRKVGSVLSSRCGWRRRCPRSGWNGASGLENAVGELEPSRNGSASRNAPSLVACMCAKSRTGRTQSRRREISTTSSTDPRSRTRPITSIPKGTAFLRLEPLAQCAELIERPRRSQLRVRGRAGSRGGRRPALRRSPRRFRRYGRARRRQT
jgi:tetratricopeptide (TPR) repeat protein